MSNNNGNEFKESIGGLWEQTSKAGNNYWSGKIEVNGEIVKVIGFRNNKATSENKQPAIRLYVKEDASKDVPF